MNKFARLAVSADKLGSLDRATHGERTASARYREVLARLRHLVEPGFAKHREDMQTDNELVARPRVCAFAEVYVKPAASKLLNADAATSRRDP